MKENFRLVTGVTHQMHQMIQNLFPQGGTLALDATLGNGHDAEFLAGLFQAVIAIDVQQSCIDHYKNPPNVRKYCMDHAEIERFHETPDIIVYNLGYLPGADKRITTTADSTIQSLKSALRMIRPGGFVFAALYYGHDGGGEARAVLDFAARIPAAGYGVMHQVFLNRGNHPPSLLIVERKKE